jgi:hypothetical protein
MNNSIFSIQKEGYIIRILIICQLIITAHQELVTLIIKREKSIGFLFFYERLLISFLS